MMILYYKEGYNILHLRDKQRKQIIYRIAKFDAKTPSLNIKKIYKYITKDPSEVIGQQRGTTKEKQNILVYAYK